MTVDQPKFQYTVHAVTMSGDHAEVDCELLSDAKAQAVAWSLKTKFIHAWVVVNGTSLVYEAPRWDDAYWDSGTPSEREARERFSGFDRKEVSSTYVARTDRFVVSLVVGYSGADEEMTPEQAAYLALDLTRDGGSHGTNWYVYDRKTGQVACLEQDEFDSEDRKLQEEAME